MFTNDNPGVDSEFLARYLLGDLPKEEAERLDEQSVTDDEFSWRVTAVENDLVDAYVRGELARPQLALFESHYLASPKRRQKVSFARAILSSEGKLQPDPAKAAAAVPRALASPVSKKKSFWNFFSVPAFRLQWGFAGAALAMTLVAGTLLYEVNHLRSQVTGVESARAALDKRQQETEKQLSEQRAVNARTQSELERLRKTQGATDIVESIAVLLMPQTRGAGQPVAISVPGGVTAIPVRLQLESDDYLEYQVTLKDPTSDRGLWHSAKLKVAAKGKNRLLALSLPASVLKQQTYILEVSGISSKGVSSLIDSYVFRVVRD